MAFTKKGIRTSDCKLSKAGIDILRNDWLKYVTAIPEDKKDYSGKGIVFTAGGVRYTTCVWVAINMLRKTGCKLPIEVWYLGNEISIEILAKFEMIGVTCRDFHDLGQDSVAGYMLKPLAIINSSFKEVLFLDADNICVKDPTELFSTVEYLACGAVFWPDYWHTAKNNPIWKIIGTKAYDIPEQESGQILINKETCWKELHLCEYFNRLSEYYYSMLHGDKDTFKFAWLALNKPFHMVDCPVGTLGYYDGDRFLGNTMVQHSLSGDILFLHRNLLKWDVTWDDEFVWKSLKRFSYNAKKRNFYIANTSGPGHMTFDIDGDVDEVKFTDIFQDLEKDCLDELARWRASPAYHRFLAYSQFARHRYHKKKFEF